MSKEKNTSKKASSKKVVAKKVTAKKAVAKTPSKVTKDVKKEISYRAIGQNVIVVVDGQQYSKKEAIKELRESLKELVLKFNARNTATGQKQIISFFNTKTEEVAKKVEKTKALKNKVSKVVEKTKANKSPITLADFEKADKLTDSEVERLEKLLSKHKKTTAPVENRRTNRRGEY